MRQYQLSLDDAQPAQRSGDKEAEEILQGLNPVQQEAASTTEGPVLIIAGPGSGKTRTLTHRIAYLLAAGKARPFEILALTFTNKAAREMKERIVKLVGAEQAKGIWMGTFHSTFARLLRAQGDKIGYSKDFTIYDTDDTERILRGMMPRFAIDAKQFSPRAMRGLISSAKNAMVSPAEYGRLVASQQQEKAAILYGPYQEALRRSNAMDFDDLLLKPIDLFQQHPDVLQKYQERWRYVHIDEYQDTNRAQYTLAKMLAARHKNLCVVGDDAQSIYAFRGADITGILSFQRDYPDATTIRLEQNYRSTKKILQLAGSIIKQNKDQLEKELWTDNREGDYVVLMEALSEKDEAQKVERTIRDLHVRGGHAWREFAVLYRTNAQSRAIEDALRRGSIPYRVIGGVSFYQRREIKDVLAYLRLLVNPNDTASLRRVINYPTRGIGGKTQDQLVDFARQEGITLWQAIERVEDAGLSSRAQKALEGFRFLIAQHAARTSEGNAAEVARALVQETGILSEFRQENTPESLMRWENVQELLNAVAEYAENAPTSEAGSLSNFLQEVSLLTSLDEDEDDQNRVTLMTLHASKGLEFSVVFVTGLEEGLFPLAKAAQDRTELEEERRLFYVGATRAQERLYLTYTRSRFRYGEHQASIRSRFLDEIDVDVVRTEAGATPNQQLDRFRMETSGKVTYGEMDPHYYRKNLSAGRQKPRRTVTQSAPINDPDVGRRIVYDEGEGEIVPGVRVEHPLFGQGKVLAVEGAGAQAKATVFFSEVGQKKLVLKFAKLQRVG